MLGALGMGLGLAGSITKNKTFGKILGGIGGFLGQKSEEQKARELMQQQQEYQKELMGLQYQYNDKAADKAHERQLDYWNKTNYEEQLKHMKNAGLSVGLMYGQGGAGGSTGAAPMGSVSGGSAPSAAAGVEGMGLGLQLRRQQAEVDLMEAQAKKANADADKTAGVDTREAESRISLNESEMKVNESIRELNWERKQEVAANFFKIQAEEASIWKDVEMKVIDKEVKEETKEAVITQKLQGTFMNTIAMLEGMSRIQLNQAQAEYVGKQIQYYFYEVVTRRMTAEAAKENAATFMDKITNDFILGKRKLDQEDTKILQDWIFRSVQGLVGIANAAGNIVGILKKPIQEMVETGVEQIFGPDGSRKGWKESTKKITKTTE